jgi:hypothetical protein
MRKIFIILAGITVSLALVAQEKPRWMDDSYRSSAFPAQSYFSGFAYGEIPDNKSLQDVTQQVKTEAQAELSKKIRLQISSQTQNKIAAVTTNGQYSENESFFTQSSVESHAEIAGVKIESHYDAKAKLVYAFAYVSKDELTGYYKANLLLQLQQGEGLLHTAEQLEQSGEKAKARKQCEDITPLLDKVRYAQDMLTAIDAASSEGLQQDRLEMLHSKAAQMRARLAQAVLVYVESSEDLFGTDVAIAAGKVKAELALKGCSFIEDEAQADFRLRLNISTRLLSSNDAIVFCYADAAIELYDIHKQKAVYTDNISQKGGSNTQDKAGRKALEDIAPRIAEKISPWIE